MLNWNNIDDAVEKSLSSWIAIFILSISFAVVLLWLWWKYWKRPILVTRIHGWKMWPRAAVELGFAYAISQWAQGDWEYEYAIDLRNTTNHDVIISQIRTCFRKGKVHLLDIPEQGIAFTVPPNANAVEEIVSGVNRDKIARIRDADNVVFEATVAGTKRRLFGIVKKPSIG